MGKYKISKEAPGHFSSRIQRWWSQEMSGDPYLATAVEVCTVTLSRTKELATCLTDSSRKRDCIEPVGGGSLGMDLICIFHTAFYFLQGPLSPLTALCLHSEKKLWSVNLLPLSICTERKRDPLCPLNINTWIISIAFEGGDHLP